MRTLSRKVPGVSRVLSAVTALPALLIEEHRKSCKSARRRVDHPYRFRPSVEELEGRWLPSQTGLTAPLADLQPVDQQVTASQAPVRSERQPGASPLAQQGGQLTIGGQPMYETEANYQDYIKWLTVPPDKQNGLFFSGTMAQIKAAGLEDPLRRQIFNAMNNNPGFVFLTLAGAQEDFTMRINVIDFMKQIQTGVGPDGQGVDFGYFRRASGVPGNPSYDPGIPSYADPAHWHKIADGTPDRTYWKAFSSNQNVSADAAINGIINDMFRGDCLGAIEITLFEAAEETIGAARFNAEHPEGLQMVGLLGDDPSMSIWTNVQPHYYMGPGSRSAPIQTQGMVPGDWVYMQNDPLYKTLVKELQKNGKPVPDDGRWTGENALYMGTDYNTGVPLFSGLGAYDVTEDKLRQDLTSAFNDVARAASAAHLPGATDANGQPVTPDPTQIYWKLLAQPITGSLRTPPTPPSPPPAPPSPPAAVAPPAPPSPPSQPTLIQKVAADASRAVQGLESGNVTLALSALEDFLTLLNSNSPGQRVALELAFVNDLFADV